MKQIGRKYEFTKEKIKVEGKVLHRIKAMRDFGDVKAGDLGGFLEGDNLDHIGNCWVYNNARVYGDAKVYDNAKVSDNARVYGDAKVYDNAWVCDNACVSDNAQIYGNACVSNNAQVHNNACASNDAQIYGDVRIRENAQIYGDARIGEKSDYIVFKNWWSSGRYFTWTRSNNMWKVGCFHGTGEELIEKAYKDSEISGREYERVVRYVESILTDERGTEKTNQLEPIKTYYLGDFILQLTDAGVLKVTSDRGVINIQPKADNAVEVKSSKNVK